MIRISLLSSSFSGSTLLSVLFAQDPDYLALGDTYLIDGISDLDGRCNCGETLRECPLRARVGHRLAGHGLAPEMLHDDAWRIPWPALSARGGGLRALPLYRALGRAFGAGRTYARFLERERVLLDELGAVSGAAHYLDGCKSIVRAEVFARADTAVRLLHLTRHPYGALHSALTRHARRGRTARHRIEGWVRYNQAAADMLHRHPGRVAALRLEELGLAPVDTVTRVCQALDVPAPHFDPAGLDPTRTHVIGNRSRHAATVVRALPPVPDTLQMLEAGCTPADLAALDRAAERFGYEPPVAA